MGAAKNAATRAPDDAVRPFLAWFGDRYRVLRDATYRVQPAKDVPLLRQLLAVYGEADLRAMVERLLTEAGDQFISQSDRGVGVLAVKASWLHERTRQAAARARRADHAGHVPPCRTFTECRERVAREIEARRASAQSEAS